MGYIDINIRYREGSLCEEISFSEPGEQVYELGSTVTLSDTRLWRDRQVVVSNINYTETNQGGLVTTISGFSPEYKYTRKAPNFDISFFSMTPMEAGEYMAEFPVPESKVYIRYSDEFGADGWTMHDIVRKIVEEWMGLSVENNLPNFDVSDYSISAGSTFFESLRSLISEFDPIIILSGGTLYILERSGAGVFMGGLVTLPGSESRSVDREYIPAPGCIRVEGTEGRDLSFNVFFSGVPIYVKDAQTDIESGGVGVSQTGESTYVLEDGSGEILSSKTIVTSISGVGIIGRSSTKSDATYSDHNVVTSEEQVCKGLIDGQTVTYCIIRTMYQHDKDFNLLSQTTTKEELFIYNSEDGSYVKFDPRDHRLSVLGDDERAVLIPSESRTVNYSKQNDETYSVDTTTSSRMWNLEYGIWDTMYHSDHDIVEAGGQQHITRTSAPTTPITTQVYAGDCPDTPEDFAVLSEPPIIFNIPTPSWESIEDCYVYLSALVNHRFQKVNSESPIIDPLPLLGVIGLGSIIESGLLGFNYVKEYTINIDSTEGSTVSLGIEARRISE